MLVSGGKILAIDQVYTDETILGDGVQKPLGVNTDLIATVSTVSSVSSKLNQDINDVSGNFQNYYKKTETSAAEEISAAFENFKTNQTIVSAGSPNVTVEIVPSGDKTIIYKVEVQEGEINIAGTSGVSAKYDNGTWTIGLSADYLSANALEDYYKKQEVNDKFTETSAWANDTFQPSGDYLSANALDNYYTKASADATFQAKGDYVSADDFDEYKTEVQNELNKKQDVSAMSAYATSAWVDENYQKKGDYVTSADDSLANEQLILKNNQWQVLEETDWTDKINAASAAAVTSAKNYTDTKLEDYYKTTETSSRDELEDEFAKYQLKGDYLSANALDDVSGAWNDVVHTVETYSAAWNEVSAYSATSGQFVTSSTESIEEGLANVLVKDENDNVTWSGVDLSKLGKIYGMSSQTPDLLTVGISADEETQEPIYVLSAAKPGEVSVPGIAGYGLSAWKDTENDEYKVSAHIVGNHGVSAAYDAEANTWNVGISANDYAYLHGTYTVQAEVQANTIIKFDSGSQHDITIDEDGYIHLPDTGNKFTFCINETVENNISNAHAYNLNKIALIETDGTTESVVVSTQDYYPTEVGSSDTNIAITITHDANNKYAVKYLGSTIPNTANLNLVISIIEEISSLATTEGGGHTYAGVEPIWVNNQANTIGLAYDREQFKIVQGKDTEHPELSALQINIQTTGGNIDQAAFEKMANMIYGRMTETFPIAGVSVESTHGANRMDAYLFRPTIEYDCTSATSAFIYAGNADAGTTIQIAIYDAADPVNMNRIWLSQKTVVAGSPGGQRIIPAVMDSSNSGTIFPNGLYYAAALVENHQVNNAIGTSGTLGIPIAGTTDIGNPKPWLGLNANESFSFDVTANSNNWGSMSNTSFKMYIGFKND